MPALVFALALPLSAAALLVTAGPGCDGNDGGCAGDADCDGLRCGADGSCVACVSNGDCNADQFCCSGACLNATDLDEHCGCSAAAGSGAGQQCAAPANVCIVGEQRANTANVSSGQCGCTCDASQGGSVCTLDAEADEGFTCSCVRTDPDGTCGKPALDDANLPHVVADTCTPTNQCVCFSAGAPCDPNSDAPDCSLGGCVNVFGDADNCGVKERNCADPATGIVDGECRDGGCQCDVAGDCQGASLNVDVCVILTDGGQCVCGDYEVDGTQAPCPLGLECVNGGCSYNGQIFSTNTALFQALGI
jgi:hypothetical protein